MPSPSETTAAAETSELRAWLTGQALVAMGMWMPPVDFDPAKPGIYSAADLSPPEQAAQRARWAVMQADAVLAELAKAVR